MATIHGQFEGDDILKCSQCDGTFLTIQDLNVHSKFHEKKKYICSGCNKSYARKRNMEYHRNHCGVKLLGGTTKNYSQTHRLRYDEDDDSDYGDETQHGEGMNIMDQHAMQRGEGASDKYFELASAFGKSLITFRKEIEGLVLEQIYTSDIPEKVSEEAKVRGSFKWYTSLSLQFHQSIGGAITQPPVVFSTGPKLLLRHANYETISKQSQSAFEEMLEHIETFQQNGSGWVIDKIIASDISIANMPKGLK